MHASVTSSGAIGSVTYCYLQKNTPKFRDLKEQPLAYHTILWVGNLDWDPSSSSTPPSQTSVRETCTSTCGYLLGWCISSLGTKTEHHGLGALETDMYFLTILEA